MAPHPASLVRALALTLALAGCAPAAEPSSCVGGKCDDLSACSPDEAWRDAIAADLGARAGDEPGELDLDLQLVDRLALPYPAAWAGRPAVTASNGAHNQALGVVDDQIYTAAQDRAGDGWLLGHALDTGALRCATRLDPALFGASATGKVHPGGGHVDDGWMVTVLSNQPSMFSIAHALEAGEFAGFADGAFILARFRVDPEPCAAGAECACEVEVERDPGGRPVVYRSGNYHGMVVRLEPTRAFGDNLASAEVVVYDIAGLDPWRCSPRRLGGCEPIAAGDELGPAALAELLAEPSVAKPQQCATLGHDPTRYQLCTTFPTGRPRLTVHLGDPALGDGDVGAELERLFRAQLGELALPALAESQFAEGIALDAGSLYLAGDASPRADCGFGGVVRPCTGTDGAQQVRIYALDQAEARCPAP